MDNPQKITSDEQQRPRLGATDEFFEIIIDNLDIHDKLEKELVKKFIEYGMHFVVARGAFDKEAVGKYSVDLTKILFSMAQTLKNYSKDPDKYAKKIRKKS